MSAFTDELIGKVMAGPRPVRSTAFNRAMPERIGGHKPSERMAREWAGGTSSDLVAWDDIPWLPVTTPRIEYPKSQNLPTKIPMMFDWSPFTQRQECRPVCRHGRQACPTHPLPIDVKPHKPPVPSPEGHKLPEGVSIKGSGHVVNTMTFDDRPEWQRHQPLEDEAKAGYTNFDNDYKALGLRLAKRTFTLADRERAFKDGRLKTDDNGRRYWKGWEPGKCWAEADKKAVKRRLGAARKRAKDKTSMMPDAAMIDRLKRYELWAEAKRNGTTPTVERVEEHEYDIPVQQYPDRVCVNCFDPYELAEHQGTNTRYCCQRCRKYAGNIRSRGMSGTVRPRDLPVGEWELAGTTYGYVGMWAS